jgi:hypothetical protein
MLIKGITQIPNIITESEKHELIDLIRATPLNDESSIFHYGNSSGNQISPEIYDRLTQVVSSITGLKIEKQNAFARIYKSGGVLKSHLDRDGLDLTLSIQLKNDFRSGYTPIFAKGYDGTVYRSDLNDCDGVLLKGRELEHWRDELNGGDVEELICIFFHWNIARLEYVEIDNFLTDEQCDEIIKEQTSMTDSMVLLEGKAQVVESIRSNKVGMYNGAYSSFVNDKLKELCGDLELEGLQLLKYDKGNKFTPHLDQKYNGKERLFTTILYLNDDYKGGNTNFPTAGLKITPKKGKLIIWKNIKKDAQGNWIDNPLTLHESLPVKSGIKYSLVQWFLM